jgi:hypothetical protein
VKYKYLIISLALTITGFLATPVSASQIPIVESFTFTPSDVDVVDVETKINFELVVSHPDGISNSTVLVTISNSKNDTIGLNLQRTDNPVNLKLPRVTFKGALVLPRDTNPGVYSVTAGEVTNIPVNGYQYSSGPITPGKIRTLVGGEFGLLVRSNGSLNLAFDTFVGPTHDSLVNSTYNDSAFYTPGKSPLLKVGETYIPSNFYELRVPSLSLGITSSTPGTCSSDGKQLKFLTEGLCQFIVSTPKTNDYLGKTSAQSITIGKARIKPELIMGTIASQSIKEIPKLVEIFRVYSPAGGYIFPKTATPAVCIGSGFFVRLVGGGTCTLNFTSEETSTYLASDIYSVSFEVIRDPQTILFTPPATANISAKTLALSATASGGGVITYQTTSTGICSITGSTLNLLKSGNCAVTATQAGTTTLAPISATATVMIAGSVAKKTITCIKGKKTKKVSGTNPKCPKGYKVKR